MAYNTKAKPLNYNTSGYFLKILIYYEFKKGNVIKIDNKLAFENM